MSPATHKKLQALHLELYEKAFEEAASYATLSAPSMLRYKQRFAASLPKNPRVSSLGEIIRAIGNSDILIFGDFHTLRQSQRGFVNLIRDYWSNDNSRRISVALEMFKAKDQALIDRFMNNEIPEQEFLSSVRYKDDWGFPWLNYKEIIDYCKENRIRVIGINCDQGGKSALSFRDSFAAKILAHELLVRPNQVIACLIGEYHLADQHLLHYLGKEGVKRKPVRVFLNIDHYHFHIDQNSKSHGAEYLYLRRKTFCILNTSPWLKWQSYALWEEQRQAEEFEAYHFGDPECHEAVIEVDDLVHRLSLKMADFLDIDVSANALASFHVHFVSKGREYQGIKQRFPSLPLRLLKEHSLAINRHGLSFVCEVKTIVFSDPSLMNIANASGRLLLHVLRKARRERLKSGMFKFYTRIEDAAAGTLAAQILNPRARSLGEIAIPEYMASLTDCMDGNGRTITMALKAKELFFKYLGQGGQFPLPVLRVDQDLGYEFSHWLGQVLGFSLYRQSVKFRNHMQLDRLMRELFSGNDAALTLFTKLRNCISSGGGL